MTRHFLFYLFYILVWPQKYLNVMQGSGYFELTTNGRNTCTETVFKIIMYNLLLFHYAALSVEKYPSSSLIFGARSLLLVADMVPYPVSGEIQVLTVFKKFEFSDLLQAIIFEQNVFIALFSCN